MKKTALTGIGGILASGFAPAFAKDMKMLKIGQLGLGSHGFVGRFKNPPANFKGFIKCKPYAIWDDVPGVAEKMMGMGFEKVINDPVKLVKESDVVHAEHADYRKILELVRPALEMGKPVFINRPFTASIADAEEIVRLARKHNAPLMGGSSLEYQPEHPSIQMFAKVKGPVRSYECYCPEPFFSWMFPHVLNFSHTALGGGIESAYFAGDYIIEMGDFEKVGDKFVDPKRPFGSAMSILTYKSRYGEPPIIGVNHIGGAPGTYNIKVYAYEETRNFIVGANLDAANIFEAMFLAQNDFYVNRIPPRPYDAILEQHRALVATNVSRLTGRAAKLDDLKGSDAVPYHESLRNYLLKRYR